MWNLALLLNRLAILLVMELLLRLRAAIIFVIEEIHFGDLLRVSKICFFCFRFYRLLLYYCVVAVSPVGF